MSEHTFTKVLRKVCPDDKQLRCVVTFTQDSHTPRIDGRMIIDACTTDHAINVMTAEQVAKQAHYQEAETLVPTELTNVESIVLWLDEETPLPSHDIVREKSDEWRVDKLGHTFLACIEALEIQPTWVACTATFREHTRQNIVGEVRVAKINNRQAWFKLASADPQEHSPDHLSQINLSWQEGGSQKNAIIFFTKDPKHKATKIDENTPGSWIVQLRNS